MAKRRVEQLFAQSIKSIQGYTGDVVGNVTGNVTGNTTGTHTGGIFSPIVNLSANGAVTVPTVDTKYFLTKAGVAAMTIVDPTTVTHDGLRLSFISTTAQAHTLSNAAGSGFNVTGASGDVGTFGGAIGDGIVLIAYGGKWLVESKVNVTLG